MPLLILCPGVRWDGCQLHSPATSLQGNRAGTHRITGWVGLGAGLDASRKSRSHRISNSGPLSPQREKVEQQMKYKQADGLTKVLTDYLSASLVHKFRRQSPDGLNFVWWCLIFVGP